MKLFPTYDERLNHIRERWPFLADDAAHPLIELLETRRIAYIRNQFPSRNSYIFFALECALLVLIVPIALLGSDALTVATLCLCAFTALIHLVLGIREFMRPGRVKRPRIRLWPIVDLTSPDVWLAGFGYRHYAAWKAVGAFDKWFLGRNSALPAILASLQAAIAFATLLPTSYSTPPYPQRAWFLINVPFVFYWAYSYLRFEFSMEARALRILQALNPTNASTRFWGKPGSGDSVFISLGNYLTFVRIACSACVPVVISGAVLLALDARDTQIAAVLTALLIITCPFQAILMRYRTNRFSIAWNTLVRKNAQISERRFYERMMVGERRR